MSQNSQQSSQDSNVPPIIILMGVRWGHIIPIVWSLLPLLSLFSSVVNVSGHVSTRFSLVHINGLGEKSGDADLLNLVSFGTGFGIYLLAGNILLIILLVVGAVTLNKWIEVINLFLVMFLLVLNPINVGLITSITIHTAIPDITISQSYLNLNYMAYFGLIVSLVGLIYSLQRKPKTSANYTSGESLETNI